MTRINCQCYKHLQNKTQKTEDKHRMKIVVRKISFLVMIACLVVLAACDYTTQKSTSTTGELTIGVDEGISPLAREEAAEFMRLNKESKLNLSVKTSKEVIAELNSGAYKTI